jgi:hypothetical protein
MVTSLLKMIRRSSAWRLLSSSLPPQFLTAPNNSPASDLPGVGHLILAQLCVSGSWEGTLGVFDQMTATAKIHNSQYEMYDTALHTLSQTFFTSCFFRYVRLQTSTQEVFFMSPQTFAVPANTFYDIYVISRAQWKHCASAFFNDRHKKDKRNENDRGAVQSRLWVIV